MTAPGLSSRQLELLRPHEIRDRLAERSVVYLPLGTIEWHCEHLPVGLDALTAHGVCLRAAALDGGVVYPPLHYGTGGGHGAYPWTVMMPGRAEIEGLLRHTLERLETLDVRLAVLFTGHFADEQVAMIKAISASWNGAGRPTEALALAINDVKGAALGPDHAGIFETTLLDALWPERVDVSRLPPRVRARTRAMILGQQKGTTQRIRCGASSGQIHATTMPQRDPRSFRPASTGSSAKSITPFRADEPTPEGASSTNRRVPWDALFHETRSVAVRLLRAAAMNRWFIASVEAGVPSLKVPNHLSRGNTPSAP